MARLWPLLALLTAAAAAGPVPLECPLPGGPDSADAATCQQYSACLWEEGRCRLADQVGYQLLQPPHVIHTGYELLLGRRSQEVTMFGDDVERLTVTAVEYDNNRMALTVGVAGGNRGARVGNYAQQSFPVYRRLSFRKAAQKKL